MGKQNRETLARQYVVNPTTGRCILIGSKTWRNLVSARTISGETAGKGVAYVQRLTDFKDDAAALANLKKEKKRIQREIKEGLHGVPKTTQVSRRGLTTLVYAKKRLDGPDITARAVEAAVSTVEDIRSGALYLDPSLSIDERYEFIRSNLASNMLSPPETAHIPRVKVLQGPHRRRRSIATAYETDSDFFDSDTEESEIGF